MTYEKKTKRGGEKGGGGERKHEIYTNTYEISCSKSCCPNKLRKACELENTGGDILVPWVRHRQLNGREE